MWGGKAKILKNYSTINNNIGTLCCFNILIWPIRGGAWQTTPDNTWLRH